MMISHTIHSPFRMMARFAFGVALVILCVSPTVSWGQDKGDYFMGDEKNLEMIVHIMGEVKRPGEYRVTDDTNLLELMAKAGGPTEFANLKSILVTRLQNPLLASSRDTTAVERTSQRTIKINLSNYLRQDSSALVPGMRPGDVVLVQRNKWHKWRSVATVIRDLSVVVSAYFIYLRASKL